MGKKKLEQLFKERFQDFREVPDEKVWNSIEASLDNKKQRKRVLPIWWPLGGIAAAMLLLLLVFNPFEDQITETEQIISDTEVTDPDVSKQENETKGETPSAIVNSPVEESVANTTTRIDVVEKENQPIVSSSDIGKIVAETSGQNSNSNKKDALAISSDKSVASAHLKEENTNENGLSNAQDQEGGVVKTIMDLEKEAIALHDETREKPNAIGNESEVEKETDAVVENQEEGKISIYDAIKEQEMERDAVAANSSGKWSVGPSVAPVYYNASGNGSPIHSDFASNSKSGNLNLSYGLTLGYEIGKKLKVRSGVHKVNFGYDTNDVVFSSSLRSSTSDKFANIDYSQNSETIVVQSKKVPSNSDVASAKEIAVNETPALDGKMVQQLGYIEVPLELNYTLMDRKFGMDLIGGFSSLFLVDNAVLLESNELVTEMGEANNVNNFNFSANFGMGFNYEIAPKFQINLEPVFKYQLNTFTNTAGSFRPYSIGVYSGLRFKF